MARNLVTALTDLAVLTFRAWQDGTLEQDDNFSRREYADPVLDAAPNISLSRSAGGLEQHLNGAVAALAEDRDLSGLLPEEGQENPLILIGGSGSRTDLAGAVRGLLYGAIRRIYFMRMEETEETFARVVIEHLEELKRAVRGEPVRSYEVVGLAGIELPDHAQISMPWGTIVPAPPSAFADNRWHLRRHGRLTRALLLVPQLQGARISHEAMLETDPQDGEVARQEMQRILEIQPLAFALAMPPEAPVAPVVTFSTDISPVTLSYGFALPPTAGWRPDVQIQEASLSSIERWGRVLNDSYHEALSIPTKRTVSAIGERTDRSDALIDAVMAWESLVGGRSETVFRVTVALAKLLKSDPVERAEFRKALGKTYDIRSRVVHGEAVLAKDINTHASDAIEVALQALRVLYERGEPWLTMTSQSRGEALIMEA